MTLPLVKYPDPLLKKLSKPVDIFDKNLQKFLDDMLETMYEQEGVGLAAVQVGVLKRILVMDVKYSGNRYEKEGDKSNKVKNSQPLFLINPEITWRHDELAPYDEGCLSFPGINAEIHRPKEVKVKYLDYDFNPKEMHCKNLMAVCLQHEIDHLDGITFVDHLSKLKRQMVLKKMKKLGYLK